MCHGLLLRILLPARERDGERFCDRYFYARLCKYDSDYNVYLTSFTRHYFDARYYPTGRSGIKTIDVNTGETDRELEWWHWISDCGKKTHLVWAFFKCLAQVGHR